MPPRSGRALQKCNPRVISSENHVAGCEGVLTRAAADPPPLKWSDLRYVFDIQEDCNGKEAIQA